MSDIKSKVILLIFILSLVLSSSAAYATSSQAPEVDLLIRTRQDQPLYIKNQTQPTVLPKGSLISVTVKQEDIEGINLERRRFNIRDLLPALTKDKMAPYIHSIVVLESKRNRSLENQEGTLNVVTLIEQQKAKLEGFENNEVESEALNYLDNILKPHAYNTNNANNTSCVMCPENNVAYQIDPVDQTLLGLLLPRFDKIIDAYSSFPVIQGLIQFAKRNISFRTQKGNWLLNLKPRRKCVRYVKQALGRMSFFIDANGESYYPTSTNSRQLIGDLKDNGFIDLMETAFRDQIRSPYDAPVGAVLIYFGGPGHSEIRTENGFVSDYFNESARTGNPERGLRGNGRELKGVFISLKVPDMG